MCNVNNETKIPGFHPAKWDFNLDTINFLLIDSPKIDITTTTLFEKTKKK